MRTTEMIAQSYGLLKFRFWIGLLGLIVFAPLNYIAFSGHWLEQVRVKYFVVSSSVGTLPDVLLVCFVCLLQPLWLSEAEFCALEVTGLFRKQR
jgi:hypothetical protein